MSERPADILLPEGWDWDRVEAARAKHGVPDHMVPVTVVPGIAVAWITINAAREDQRAADTSGEIMLDDEPSQCTGKCASVPISKQWACTGERYGGDEPGEGRSYCIFCGMDGDA